MVIFNLRNYYSEFDTHLGMVTLNVTLIGLEIFYRIPLFSKLPIIPTLGESSQSLYLSF